MRSRLILSLSLFLLLVTYAIAQDKSQLFRCSEIAHRIACHAVSDCKKQETTFVFEKRANLEAMIEHLCVSGPDRFSEYWWIDVTGAYLKVCFPFISRPLRVACCPSSLT